MVDLVLLDGSNTLGANIPNVFSYMRDEKPNGTVGGSSITTPWQTRDLNSITNYGNIDITLNSNQFTLGPGTYMVFAKAPFAQSNRSVIRLYNTTSGTSIVVGTGTYSDNAVTDMSMSVITGAELLINVSSVFEIQYNCQTASASTGLGYAMSAGSNEIYTQVSVYRLY